IDGSRFISPDPLIVYQQKYAELSPYQFASNSPLKFLDIDGLEAGEPGWGAYMGSLELTSPDAYKLELKMQEISRGFSADIAKFSVRNVVESGINLPFRGIQMVTNPILYNITGASEFRGRYTLINTENVASFSSLFESETYLTKTNFLSDYGGNNVGTWNALGDGVSTISFGFGKSINIGVELGFTGIKGAAVSNLSRTVVVTPLKAVVNHAAGSSVNVENQVINQASNNDSNSFRLGINLGISLDKGNNEINSTE
ncbi:MAG: hypothetical protein KF690_09110, partial [Bacteroidetes bacterium]|nr:hypothetical protein [Bacteroidota bacterium]